jgi:N-acetylmuramoyl-L-alanine amidase
MTPGRRPAAAGHHPGRRPGVAAIGVAAVVLAVSACGAGPSGSTPSAGGTPTVSPVSPVSPASPPAVSPSAGSSATPVAPPLAGKIIGIDPGHNGGNFTHPAAMARLIWNGAEWETCDTTGTETDSGYTEAQFNFNVALDLRADLLRDGAQVVMTRTGDDGVGPCVNRRAEIINAARANVAVDIHADGGPVSGRGFTILEPVADGPNDSVIATSRRFGADVRQAMLAGTPMPESDYVGVDGILPRDDLAGLNLTTVPKVLIECGNMRNATDAGLLVTARFQQQVAAALTAAIVRFLRQGG